MDTGEGKVGYEYRDTMDDIEAIGRRIDRRKQRTTTVQYVMKTSIIKLGVDEITAK